MEISSYNPFTSARQQLDKAVRLLELDDATQEFLRNPMREFHFSIPIQMDDGRMHIFRGYRVMHNDARGPAKGGIRFHPHETIDTIRALAMWMSWKTAVADLPLGGAKGGVICDPHNLSLKEQERICRGWVRQLVKNIGPEIDVPAPEVMTNPQHMLWMLDEYETIIGRRTPGFITGKPVEMGGSLGRKEATGYGVVISIREALKELSMQPGKTTASIQGFGNVAQNAIELYNQMGGTVICVSSWDPHEQKEVCFCKKDGIVLKELKPIANAFGEINKDKALELGYEILKGDSWISQNVDILIPAALENAVTIKNVGQISSSVKLVAEAANGPTSIEADEFLKKKGVFIIPDFLANAGGVTCSYFEQVQSNMNYYWTKDEILAKLDEKITSAYINVSDFAMLNKMGMRDAAYVISVDKVARACKDRGWV